VGDKVKRQLDELPPSLKPLVVGEVVTKEGLTWPPEGAIFLSDDEYREFQRKLREWALRTFYCGHLISGEGEDK